MKNWTASEVVAFVRNAGFKDMKSLALCALTHRTKMPVINTTAIDVTKKKKAVPRLKRGSLQPGGDIYAVIVSAVFSFTNGAPVRDVVIKSGHSESRCTKVIARLIKEGAVRREGKLILPMID